jgi:hypothetical protein
MEKEVKMNDTSGQRILKPLEALTIKIGFVLAGIVIAVTGVSYLLNMEFQYQWLVWIMGIAFIGVGLITVEWIRAFSRDPGDLPQGGLRMFLLLAMPLSYIIDSQICGLGLKACNTACHVFSYLLLALAAVMAIQLFRNKPVALFLIPTVILSLVPHCTCHAPINTIWHSLFGGIAPTCFVMPLAVVLFSLTAMRGLRTRLSTIFVVLMLIVIAFCAVGNALFGFPWQGCMQ